MNFSVNIQLGNEAMETGDDVARALRKIASDVSEHGVIADADEVRVGIRDENGNTVGYWKVA